jgi:hypothetical protein
MNINIFFASLGIAACLSFSTAHGQPGEYEQALGMCNEAVNLEKQREAEGKPSSINLNTYCTDFSDSAIQDFDWYCVVKAMKQGSGLEAAQQSCNRD